jgi:hypothetical protein
MQGCDRFVINVPCWRTIDRWRLRLIYSEKGVSCPACFDSSGPKHNEPDTVNDSVKRCG